MGKFIDVDIFFYKGARKEPPFGEAYRPHLVVDGSTNMLGVQFDYLEKISFEEHIIIRLALLYDSVDYSPLIENVHFLIKEGSKSVGEGIVLHNPAE